jgi:hypothetical protein
MAAPFRPSSLETSHFHARFIGQAFRMNYQIGRPSQKDFHGGLSITRGLPWQSLSVLFTGNFSLPRSLHLG